jgi:hypothetical protein
MATDDTTSDEIEAPTPDREPTDDNRINHLFSAVAEHAETGDSELILREPFTGAGEPDRFRLRLWHPNSGETDIGLRYTPKQFEAFLHGLRMAYEGRISRRADTDD